MWEMPEEESGGGILDEELAATVGIELSDP